MAVTAAFHHSGDRTRTVRQCRWTGCVEQNVEVPVSQSMQQIVDDPVPQVVIDTVVGQIADVLELECQEAIPEQIVDFGPRKRVNC